MSLVEGQIVVSSKDVADKFSKTHRDVTRAISAMDCSAEFRARNFTHSEYVSAQNKRLACYSITRDGFAFLCMGFTGKQAAHWKELYISAFNKMAKALISEPPASMRALNELTKKIETDKGLASVCGAELAKYKKIKKQNSSAWVIAINRAQLQLGLSKENKNEH